jgi:3-phenylpropionate/cinnamic acid dioxygenase small subunit
LERHPDCTETCGQPGLSGFDEDKRMLAKRVDQILTGVHYAEEPLSRINHMVSNMQIKAARPEIDEVCELDVCELVVTLGFRVYQIRVEYQTDSFVGRRHDTLRPTDKGWKIARREILLEQSILLAKNLTTFFLNGSGMPK